MDLFTPIVKTNKLDSRLASILTDENLNSVRSVIQSWASGLELRAQERRKFITEFQQTFDSSFWELYLNAVLVELGFDIDRKRDRPDFVIQKDGAPWFTIEACTSTKGEGDLRDPLEVDHSKFLDDSTLKASSVLKRKHDEYLGIKGSGRYGSLTHVQGRPFIVAFAPHDHLMTVPQNNVAINRVLYGIDQPKKIIDAKGQPSFIVPEFKSITTRRGANIDLGIFTNDSHKEISAVIFSTTATFGKALVTANVDREIRSTWFLAGEDRGEMRWQHSNDYHEHLFDGLHIYHNPYAQYPLDKHIFEHPNICQHTYTPENGMIFDYKDHLVSRHVFHVFQENIE
ncbi:hypothetical protein [Shewanella algae]|uniref:hypothetical protein n=1 Tax=Shewanella algae TaxID=38313 RepID=UPI0031F4C7F6